MIVLFVNFVLTYRLLVLLGFMYSFCKVDFRFYGVLRRQMKNLLVCCRGGASAKWVGGGQNEKK